MDPNLAATIQGASQQVVPTTAYPELAQYYKSAFQLPLSQAGVRALSGQATVTEEQRQFDTKRKLSQAQEGGGYKQVARNDGGYGFYDPDGREVSAHAYARATGKNVGEILADSENPIDIGFREDYRNLQDFMQAAMGGDREKLDAYYEQNPALKELSPQEVLNRFRQSYPTVYGGTNRGTPVGRTFVPSLYDFRRGDDIDSGIVGD
jgi:hypothetical protein